MPLWDHAFPGIHIDGHHTFVSSAAGDLNLLRSRPLGLDLLTLISKRCQGIGTKVVDGKVVIRRVMSSYNRIVASTMSDPDDDSVIMRNGRKIPGTAIQLVGYGSSSCVTYDPVQTVLYSQAISLPTPTYIVLAHELIHSLHFLSGDWRNHDDFDTLLMHEEARTIGTGIYANARLSENSIRREWGQTQMRTFHRYPGDCDGLVSVIPA